MEQALRAADAAGDTAAATKLAQAIRGLEAPTAAANRGFVGPTQEQAGIPRLDDNMNSPLDAGIAAADLVISGARGLVNKPALTLQSLVSGTAGAISPSDTFRDAYWRSNEAGRADIEAGRGLVGSERLRTPQGEIAAEAIGGLPGIRHIGQAINWAGEKIENFAGPEARDVVESAVTLGTVGRVPATVNAARRAPLTAEGVVSRSNTGGSAGAAAAATDISGISPELRKAIAAQGSRNPISPEVLARHVEADTLPVPIRLTKGEATQDIVQISNERNIRGKEPEMARHMDETNKALGQNMQALRDQVGERVFSTNMVEHGDTLIAAYKAKDAAAERVISGNYQALRDAAGGDFPVDAKALLSSASDRLHQNLLFDHAPREIMATLTRLADNGSMTFENFESLRTNLARIRRSVSADGNTVAAAGIIRQAMEELPLAPGAAELKPLADKARASALARFKELETDPAYDAAITESVPPDRFVQKFIIGAPRDQLAVTMRNLDGERSTVSVAVLDYLREQARLDPTYSGNFSASGYSHALEGLSPKANLIFDQKTAETLGKLRNVARYTTFQPRGSFVNNSNTLVGSMAKAGAAAAEGAVNFQFAGLPVGTVGRRLIERSSSRRFVRDALEPGAGLRGSTALRYADRE